MENKHFNDKEIKKALECCGDDENLNWCTACPYYDKENDFCQEHLHRDVLNLINRQNDRIQRMKIESIAIRVKANKYEKLKLLFCELVEEFVAKKIADSRPE